MNAIYYYSGDNRLRANILGEGPPLVLYPGLAGTYEDSLAFLGKLAAEYTLITPDLRGLGESVCYSVAKHTWDQYTHDIVELLDTLGLDRANIGGVSFGAAISLAAVLRQPTRFDSAIMLSPVHLGNSRGFTSEQQRWFDDTTADGEIIMKKGLGTLLRSKDSATQKDLTARWGRHDELSLGTFLSSLNALGHPFDDLDELINVSTSTLILAGADWLHPAEVGRTYVSLLPKVKELPRPPESSGIDIGQHIAAEVRAFLGRG